MEPVKIFFWIYVLFMVVYVDGAKNVTQEERGKFEGQVLPGPTSRAIMHPTRQITIGKFVNGRGRSRIRKMSAKNITVVTFRGKECNHAQTKR